MGFRKRSDLEDMRDVQKILSLRKELAPVTEELDKIALDGLGPTTLDDLKWRAGHHRVDPNFWYLAAPDFQRQLSSGPSIHVDFWKSEMSNLNVEEQTISNLPFFATAQIVRYTFRFFHRSDGERPDLAEIAWTFLLNMNRISSHHGTRSRS